VDERTRRTLGHYETNAARFWEGTRDHDVSQNIDALLSAIGRPAPLRILDFGCGPGRDLEALAERGHLPVGLDGCEGFVAMARQRGREVLHQDFLSLDLPARSFDGVFANASLFHVPSADLPRVIGILLRCLVPGGVLLSSNPRGASEGWYGERYGCNFELDRWREIFAPTGFIEIDHYYRPKGEPCAQQPWLVTVWRAPSSE
jgi:SAM-dependent methyltransferase